MAKSQAAILLIGKQEEAVPFLFSQPQAHILVNTCKVQTTLLTALVKYKQMYLQLARPSETWKDREKKKNILTTVILSAITLAGQIWQTDIL